MAGTFTNIDIGQKTFNMNSGQWSEHLYSMVKLNLDGSNYVTSPYITVDDSVMSLQESGRYRIVCTSTTAEAGWYWYKDDVGQAYATEVHLQQTFGLVFHYPLTNPSVSKELGDEIIITKTDEYNGSKIEASYTRRGAILEVDCPLIRNVIPTSPYVGVDAAQWEIGAESSMLHHENGTYEFTYNSQSWSVVYNGVLNGFASDSALWNVFGITIYYPDESSAKTQGDSITVIRSTDETIGQPHYEYIYNQVEGASPAQQLANNIFVAIQGLGYQPLHADNAIFNPAAEIGDTIMVCGVTSGLYYQETTFNRLMASSVGAPVSSESDPEMEYESKQDRNYARKFADIAAEFNIQADQISAKVTKTSPAGQSSFSWELFDDHWAVKHNGDNMLYIDSEGSQFAGTVMANRIAVGEDITIGGQTIDAGWIQGSLAGDYNQIDYGTIGGGGGGNLAFGMDGVDIGNVVDGIVTSLRFADFSDSVFNAYGYGASTVMTWGLMDARTGAGFTPKTIQYKDWSGRNAAILVWGNTD